MDTVKLTGKTRKGKNRINELGMLWRVMRQVEKLPFNGTPGPWLSIEPIGFVEAGRFRRWVNMNDDADFIVEVWR